MIKKKLKRFFPSDYTPPEGLLPLFHNTSKLRTPGDPNKIAIREDAKNLEVPCIFNVEKHPNELNLILHRMSRFMPRTTEFPWNLNNIELVS